MGILEVGSQLPAPLLASLADFTASGGADDAREVVHVRNRLWRGAMESLRPAVTATGDYVRLLKGEGRASDRSELEAAVPLLLEKERRLASQREQILEQIEALRSSASEHAPELLDDVKHTSIALDDLLATWLEALRDLRWEAMLILAEREPREAGSPIETPEQVAAWFAELDKPEK